MKRDIDLVRKILFQVEEKGQPRGWVDLAIPGYTPEQVAHHVWLLHDAGLIEAQDLSHTGAFDYRPKRLTWAGHEFLDAARNDTIWNRTKETVKEKGGSIPFEVLKGLLLKVAASLFALN
jgi:Hypothetical protein (DUF2513)